MEAGHQEQSGEVAIGLILLKTGSALLILLQLMSRLLTHPILIHGVIVV